MDAINQRDQPVTAPGTLTMANLSELPLSKIKMDLLKSSKECSQRRLFHSAKWSTELASSLPPLNRDQVMEVENTPLDEQFIAEYDSYVLAKSYFDVREFQRAAHCVKGCQSGPAYFLHCYSLYLAGEKKKRYDMSEVIAPGNKEMTNNELQSLKEELQRNRENLDGYCLYLVRSQLSYFQGPRHMVALGLSDKASIQQLVTPIVVVTPNLGVTLKEMNIHEEAINVLLEAIKKEPLHWGSWLELASLCKNREMLQSMHIPKHWMAEFFYAYAELEVQMNDEALTRYQNLCEAGFSKSTFVQTQMALVYYNLRDHKQASELFQKLHETDPYMLDHVDTYSNILYIQENKTRLSYLAHHLCDVDRYRVETCGVIGNYYSLQGDHEKAVLYFRQALKLNPQHAVAWTLIGHEYVELKNTHAAIEAYRRATEVNPRDYRAWYGLGQTYELLKMPYYSLFYYKEAQRLRPNDQRMLEALGDTYCSLDKHNEAKKCYWRARRIGDPDGQVTVKLGKLLESSGEEEEAFKLFIVFLEQVERLGGYQVPGEIGYASLFVGRYHLKNKRYQDADIYARKATDYVETREEGRSLLYDIAKAVKGVDINEFLSFTQLSGPKLS